MKSIRAYLNADRSDFQGHEERLPGHCGPKANPDGNVLDRAIQRNREAVNPPGKPTVEEVQARLGPALLGRFSRLEARDKIARHTASFGNESIAKALYQATDPERIAQLKARRQAAQERAEEARQASAAAARAAQEEAEGKRTQKPALTPEQRAERKREIKRSWNRANPRGWSPMPCLGCRTRKRRGRGFFCKNAQCNSSALYWQEGGPCASCGAEGVQTKVSFVCDECRKAYQPSFLKNEKEDGETPAGGEGGGTFPPPPAEVNS
jgi:hypothetical protein